MTMRLPAVESEIDRRLLVNYRVDPERAAALIPAPFRPQLIDGHAVAGICLIRLRALRPAGLPRWLGLRSENAAHRIAVEWDDGATTRTGVYIPRRDTDSRVSALVGGRCFPGTHHRARFEVAETTRELRVAFEANDGSAFAEVVVQLAGALHDSRLFSEVAEASRFFERGSIGYAATPDGAVVDGLELRTRSWRVDPVTICRARSSWFDDETRFPPGTARLDCALLMRTIPAAWRALPSIETGAPVSHSPRA
jgi:hypothetical protein